MTVHHVSLPRDLRFRSAIDFVQRLHNLPDADEYVFDFGTFRGWVEPFGLLLVANAIKKFYRRKRREGAKFSRENLDEGVTTHNYAAHMGFFKFFRLNFGKEPGEAPGSLTYLPLTTISLKDILDEGYQRGQHQQGDIVEAKSAELATMLLHQSCGDLFDTVAYCFREMIRNVIEHSGAPEFSFCAQYWHRSPYHRPFGEVEIALIDTGNGLRTTLGENPHLQVNTDADAVNLALMPGVSGKMYKGKQVSHNDHWQNSGFGLYMLHRICRNGGSFFIVSGEKGRVLKKDSQEYIQLSHKGTALRLRMRTDRITVLEEMLAEFREDGDGIARLHQAEEVLTAPLASRFIREGFRTPTHSIDTGDRVRHQQYGIGIVIGKEVWNGQLRLSVRFGENRLKKVLASNVVLVDWPDEEYPF